jgi:acyl-CoA thioesterase-1
MGGLQYPRFGRLILAFALLGFVPVAANAATVVAFGASNTYGKGVARNQAYPAQLEAILRAKGLSVRVVNAGINGDTTGNMLRRMDRAVPKGTSVVILQPGGNDGRKGKFGETGDNVAEIRSRLAARGVKVIMMENSAFRGLPKQPDGQHATPDGYRMLAESVASEVASAVGR